MQYTSFTIAALSVGSALAQTVHVVTVGGPNGTTEFLPNSITANPGDMVQFQFNPDNHTVTQSNFANPCTPIQSVLPTVEGFFSGFDLVGSTDTVRPAFTVAITDNSPIWVYCSQAKHCQAGMSMVINQNASTPTSSIEAYQEASKSVTTEFLIPVAFSSSSSTSSNSSSSNTSSSSSSSSSGTSSSSGSSSSGSNTTVVTGQPPVVSGSGSSSSGSSGSSGSGTSSSGSSTTSSAGTAKVTTAGASALGVSSLLSLAAVAAGIFMM